MNTIRALAPSLLLAAGLLVGPQAQACALPLQQSGVIQVPAGVMNGIAYVSVPRGHRYVVEYVSASIRLQSTTEFSDFNVGVASGLQRVDHVLASVPGYTQIDRMTSGPVKFYAEPGSRVSISVVRGNASVATTGHYAISGCLLRVAG